MMFETVRWGLPNAAMILALAVMPLLSLAMPNERQPASVQFESAEFDAPATVEIKIAVAE